MAHERTSPQATESAVREALKRARTDIEAAITFVEYFTSDPALGLHQTLKSIDGALSSIEGAVLAERWQTIETAPLTSEHVLVVDDGVVSEAYYDTSQKGWWLVGTHHTDAYDGQLYPTHWMPKPEPPK